MSAVIYQPKGPAGEYGELAVNPYLNCTHGCTYCYCPQFLHKTREEFFRTPTPRKDFLKNLEKDCKKLAAVNAPISPIFLSFIGDCYQPFEAEAKITRRTIEIIKQFGLNFTILTKAGELAQRDFDLYGPGDTFGTTLTFVNELDSLEYEPKADIPFWRLETLKVAHKMGIKTFVSCEPVIRPDSTLWLIEIAAPYVDMFKIGKLNHQEPPEPIDWRKFALDAIDLLEKLHKSYVIKRDLAKYLNPAVEVSHAN
jgi:DNA repair photolyase